MYTKFDRDGIIKAIRDSPNGGIFHNLEVVFVCTNLSRTYKCKNYISYRIFYGSDKIKSKQLEMHKVQSFLYMCKI